MDREISLGNGDNGPATAEAAGALVLPSRRVVRDSCRAALAAGSGPFLLTGEAGIGKTWLWKGLAATPADDRRWVAVDLTPTAEPADLLREIGHALGLVEPVKPGSARRALADFLSERAEDGRRWNLVLDEAQNASAAVLEEVRLLSNRLGQPDGFAGMLLVGQTPLARRFATRPLAALEARLAARFHLRPLDADEARDLLDHRFPGHSWALPEVESIHRQAAGNPQLLLRIAFRGRQGRVPRPSEIPVRDDQPVSNAQPPSTTPPAPVATTGTALGVPLKPPIRIGDGLIEVGWDAEADPLPEDAPAPEPIPAAEEADGLINDHYAALQAWNEWARNQGRQTSTTAGEEADPGRTGEPVAGPNGSGSSAFNGHPLVWADGRQEFAPYSQLFSRLSQAKDLD